MNSVDFFSNRFIHFDIVQVGCGGSGGYIVQRLAKLLSNVLKVSDNAAFHYTLVDADIVETKNLQRQPFLPHDVNKNKAKILAERYGKAYQLPIFYKDMYVESVDDLESCFRSNNNTFVMEPRHVLFKVIIAAVDNHASRKIMHQYFSDNEHVIYLDCGIDGILLEGTPDEIAMSGYSGHCVCGIRTTKTELPSVGEVYPDILEDTESLLPSQSCGQNVVSQPQRMQSNEMAALIMMGYCNQLFAERRLYHSQTNFNALTHVVRPVLLTAPTKAVVLPIQE